MAGVNAFITEGLGSFSDVPHFLLTGLGPNGSIPEVDFSGACTVGSPTCAGTITPFHALDVGGIGSKPRASDYTPAPRSLAPVERAQIVWAARGQGASPSPRASGTLWAQPVSAFLGRLATGRPGALGVFTHDDRPIFEEEGFLLGLLLADDDED